MIPEYFTALDVMEMSRTSRNTVYVWYREHGLPYVQETRRAERKTTPQELWDWIERHGAEKYKAQLLRRSPDSLPEDRELTQEEENLRLTKARADAQELQNAQLRGELGQIVQFDQAFRASQVITRQTVVAMASRYANELARMIDPAEIKRLLVDECKRALADAAQRFEDTVRSTQRDKDIDSEPDAPSLAVGGREAEHAAGRGRTGTVSIQQNAVGA